MATSSTSTSTTMSEKKSTGLNKSDYLAFLSGKKRPRETSSSSSSKKERYSYIPVEPPPPPPPPLPTFSPSEELIHVKKFENIDKDGKLSLYLTDKKFDLYYSMENKGDPSLNGKKAGFIEDQFRDMIKEWSGKDFIIEMTTNEDIRKLKKKLQEAKERSKNLYYERWLEARKEKRRLAEYTKKMSAYNKNLAENKKKGISPPNYPKAREIKIKRPFAIGSVYFYKKNTGRKIYAYLQRDGTVFIKGSSGDEYSKQFASELVNFISTNLGLKFDIKNYETVNMCAKFIPRTSKKMNISLTNLHRYYILKLYDADYEAEIMPALTMTVEERKIMLYPSGTYLIMGAKSVDEIVSIANTLSTYFRGIRETVGRESKVETSTIESKSSEVAIVPPLKTDLIDDMISTIKNLAPPDSILPPVELKLPVRDIFNDIGGFSGNEFVVEQAATLEIADQQASEDMPFSLFETLLDQESEPLLLGLSSTFSDQQFDNFS
jgi:TATA-box binding protein (TBP) (component of TFIID and TFIIIB)